MSTGKIDLASQGITRAHLTGPARLQAQRELVEAIKAQFQHLGYVPVKIPAAQLQQKIHRPDLSQMSQTEMDFLIDQHALEKRLDVLSTVADIRSVLTQMVQSQYPRIGTLERAQLTDQILEALQKPGRNELHQIFVPGLISGKEYQVEGRLLYSVARFFES